MADRKMLYRDPTSGHVSEVGVNIDDSTPGHTGEILIWDSVAAAYVPGDPLVQGLYAAGSSVTSPPINPVLVGGSDYAGSPELQNLKVDSGGQIYIGNSSLAVTTTGQINTTDSNNTSTISLAANGIFTGTATNVTNFATIEVGVYSDVSSATNGVSIQWSPDGSNWDYISATTFTGGTGLLIPSPVLSKYYRVVYTNGVTSQTAFRLYSLLIPVSVVSPTSVLTQMPTQGSLAVLNRSVLTGYYKTDSVYQNVGVDSNGNLLVDQSYLGNNPISISAPGVQKVGIVGGSGGAVIDSALAAAKPANAIQVSGNDGTHAYAIPLSSGGTAVLVSDTAAESSLATIATAVTTGPVPVSGAFYPATQPVSIATMPSTPVTGTFYQATQPVSIAGTVATSSTQLPAALDGSGNLKVAVENSSLAVTGTFYQATQPVSIATMPSTPVTGTFYQATQPVSIASMPSTPVTGTFWQATQPVSGTVTTTPPSHASTNVDEWNGTAVDTNSGNKSDGTLRVVVATDQPNLTTALNVHDASPSAISIASAQKIEVYDGTNTAVVKAASTAAADTDTSLVVQLNPKQPNLDTALNVHDASPASQAVTNAGTFAVQAACTGTITVSSITTMPALVAGSANIGGVEIIDSGGTNKLGVNASGQVTISNSSFNVGTVTTLPAISGTVTTTPPSHASTNVDQWAGTGVDTNSGNKSAGTLRVVLATDQPNLTTALNVHDPSPASVAVTNAGTFAVQAACTGTVAVSGVSGVVEVGPTGSANTKTNPFFSSATDGTNVVTASISALGVAPTGTKVETVNNCDLAFGSGGYYGLVTQAVKAGLTAIVASGSSRQVYGYTIFNPNTYTVWVSWYNNSSATVGATNNMMIQIGVPAGAAANLELSKGVQFGTGGIQVAAATTETGNTNPATGCTVTTFYF
jgi:hypothetical protein